MLLRVFAAMTASLVITTTGHTQDGQLDPTFGTNGVVTFDATVRKYITDIALQPDGRIVLAGTIVMNGGNTGLVMRLLPDGTLDPSFSFDGMAYLDLGDGTTGNQVTVRNDGRIAVLFDHRDEDATEYPAVAVFNTDGSLYTGFNGTGVRVFSEAPGSNSQEVIALPANELLVTSSLSGEVRLWKLRADGSMQTDFSFDGAVITHIPDHSSSWGHFFAHDDGSVLVCGPLGSPGLFAARYLPNGELDQAFGTSGVASISIGEDHDDFIGAQLRTDGRIQMVLYQGYEPDDRIQLLTLLPDGSPDEAFGPGGVRSAPTNTTTFFTKALFQPDGNVLLVGTTFYLDGVEEIFRPCITRVDQDLVPDPLFGTEGTTALDVSAFDLTSVPYFLPCVLQPDGKILAATSFDNGPSMQVLVARYLNDLGTTAPRTPDPAVLGIGPNPANSSLRIDLPETISAKANLQIIDATGRIVMEQNGLTAASHIQLDLSELAPGPYTVYLMDGGSSYSAKLAITR